MLSRPCLPQVIRDFRLETICESAVSSSLKQMALAAMGIALLAGDVIGQELADQRLISCACERGKFELDSAPYSRDEGLAQQVAEVISAMERSS
jgi:DNA-binding transcriptional LysR family regulator